MQTCTGIGDGARFVATNNWPPSPFVNVSCSQQRSQRIVCTSSHSTPTPLRMHSTIVKQQGQSMPNPACAEATEGAFADSVAAVHAARASARTEHEDTATERRMSRVSATDRRSLQQITPRTAL